ncbi:AAA family ATPase [Kitasatospora phosalacinea]|uniref:AAA family ATPase n=1 Tax=Kitasatospora phosalacinea TaxID=2065 RepID=UPI00365D1D15
MSALTLVHLTSVGPDKPPASVEFGPHLTVIYGASESGKSYIVEAIDYMLGASQLKNIREADGYTHILLGLRTADNRVVTLARELGGATKVDIFDADLRTMPTSTPNDQLNVKHNPRADNNLSRYLLRLLGLDGKRVLKSASQGQLRTLSFRDLAHLSVISDTKMADPRSPVLASGQNTSAPAEKSVFKLLLTGEEEPERTAGASDVDKKVGKGRLTLLDELITDAQSNLALPGDESELQSQLLRLEETLASATAANGDLVAQRFALVEHGRSLSSRTTANRERAGELRTLLGRFDLLSQQYESDLDRLRMVAEAGNLLGYFFQGGPCVFCGAAPEHQQPDHQLAETAQLHAAVATETRKTTELHADLITTMEDLEDQLSGLDEEHTALSSASGALSTQLGKLDDRLAPLHEDTKVLLATRSKIQADLALHAQIQRMENMKATMSNTTPAPESAQLDGIPSSDIADFESTVREILTAWQLPGDNRVTYDQKTAEISVDDRPRSSRGRGMRSIIHAAFTMALAKYTAGRSLPHPGFVVLDSPLLTYREPDEDDIKIPYDVVAHFYRTLHDDPSAQVIVVENVDPPRDLGDQATVYPFHIPGADRMGFYPA